MKFIVVKTSYGDRKTLTSVDTRGYVIADLRSFKCLRMMNNMNLNEIAVVSLLK